MCKWILSLLFVCNVFAFEIIPARVVFEQVDDPDPGRQLDTSWILSIVQFDSPYFLTGAYWGIAKRNVDNNKVAYAVQVYGSGRNGGSSMDTMVETWDSTYQHPDYIWKFDELKAAPAGKVQVSIVRSDSIYLIISDTLKTTIYSIFQHNWGYWWNKHAVINQSYPNLEYATVQNKQIVFNYPSNPNGWTISHGNLFRTGVTYSSPGIYAIGYPVIDYKNNVWFYASTPTDTMLIKLEAWNNFQTGFSYIDSARGYIKFIMNISTDIISGYVGKHHIYKSYLSHPPTYIGPDTIINATHSYTKTSSRKVKFHQDTAFGYISTTMPYKHFLTLQCNDTTFRYIESDTALPVHWRQAQNRRTQTTLYRLTDRLANSNLNDGLSGWGRIWIDSFYVTLHVRSHVLDIDSMRQKSLYVGDFYRDTIITYGATSPEITSYRQLDSVLQLEGKHPDITKSDGLDIYLTSTLPSWITATKINPYMIVLSGVVPDVPSVNTTLSIVDSMIYYLKEIFNTYDTTYYRTASTPLRITINRHVIPPVNHPPVAANDTTIYIAGYLKTCTYTLQATDADNDELSYWFDSPIPVTLTNNVFVFSLINVATGSYLIKLYVSDSAATDSCMITLNIRTTSTAIINSISNVRKPAILYTVYNTRGQITRKTYNIKDIAISNGKYIVISNKQISKPITIIK